MSFSECENGKSTVHVDLEPSQHKKHYTLMAKKPKQRNLETLQLGPYSAGKLHTLGILQTLGSTNNRSHRIREDHTPLMDPGNVGVTETNLLYIHAEISKNECFP